jgi:AcrR family transcriptional regulator
MPAADPMTRTNILDGAVTVLQRDGLGDLSIRKVATAAGVPLSQVHYHFGSKQGLLLAILARDSERLLARQTEMYGEDAPLWKQWEQACDFYDDDLATGYVRNLQEMFAAGWSDPDVANAVRDLQMQWQQLLTRVAEQAYARSRWSIGLSPADIATMVHMMWLGAEEMQLLGFEEAGVDLRGVLRRIGELLRLAEE